jgi:hypothetical protein
MTNDINLDWCDLSSKCGSIVTNKAKVLYSTKDEPVLYDDLAPHEKTQFSAYKARIGGVASYRRQYAGVEITNNKSLMFARLAGYKVVTTYSLQVMINDEDAFEQEIEKYNHHRIHNCLYYAAESGMLQNETNMEVVYIGNPDVSFSIRYQWAQILPTDLAHLDFIPDCLHEHYFYLQYKSVINSLLKLNLYLL